MRNKVKKICSVIAAVTLLSTAFSFASCKDSYKGTKIEYTTPSAPAVSNGGFAVKYGEYVYFINGVEDNTAKNKYGDVVKGALMRIKDSDLQSSNYDKAETVVPMLFVAKDYDAGIYIYGDYVYYATPTTDKTVEGGQVANTQLDFKRAKLDGSEAMKDYYFRLTSNTANYRFVQAGEKDTVYCLYEKDGNLYSFNTETRSDVMLVKGASTYYYDTDDLSNPNVYYTMSVTKDLDKENQTKENYNQLYVVNAAATATANASEASYTVKGGKTYKFDKAGLKANYDSIELDKYSTYPYVNLGTLVLDGIGSISESTQYNDATEKNAMPGGYTYTVRYYKNNGVYLTRSDSSKLLYLPANADGNSVKRNEKLETVALSASTNATESAVFTMEGGKHVYFYLSDTTLYKATANADGTAETLAIAKEVATDVTLWKLNGDYLYYYGSGTRDRSLNRINYTGDADDYNNLLRSDEYKPLSVSYVDLNDDWYQPEFFGDTLLYPNAQYFGQGATSYNYIYATKTGATADLKAAIEAYDEVIEEIDSQSGDVDLQNAMTYYFRTGETSKFDAAAAKELYDANQTKAFAEFKESFKDKLESNYIRLVGKQNEADKEAIDADWDLSILQEEEEKTESGLPGWAIGLIIGGSVVVVGAIVAIVIVAAKKKAAKKKEDEATVNAYKRKKIDTTDDKSIDVYATEESAETQEETSEKE